MNLKPFITAQLIALLVGNFLSGSALCDVSISKSQEPSIVQRNGKDILLLPRTFLAHIKAQFPKLRLPGSGDITGAWLLHQQAGSLPYITWGDFNGDEMTDLAVILISEKTWKFVVLHKTREGYVSAFSIPAGDEEGQIGRSDALIQFPQDMVIGTLKRGEKKVINIEQQTFEYKFDFDAITFLVDERSYSLFFWKDGKYESINFMD